MTVMFLAAVMLTIVVLASRETQIELRIANNELLAKQALNVAEAGLNHAFSHLKADTNGFNDELSNGGTLDALGTVAVLDSANYRFRAFGGGASDGYYVRVVDNFDEKTGSDNPLADKDGAVTVISRGRVGGAERIVEAHVAGTPLFAGAIFGKTAVTISGGAQTDSYDSSAGAYSVATAGSNGDVRSNGSIALSGGSIIHGDATAGTTISPWPTGTAVTGTATQSAPPVNYPSVAACGPPYYVNTGGISCSGGSCSYVSSTGVLTVGNNSSTATIANGTYCLSAITLSGGGSLAVNGPVQINVTGKVNTSGGSVQNTTHLAANLQIFSSYAGNNAFVLSGGSGAYMTAYDPDGQIVCSGGSDFFGALVGSSVTESGGLTRVHYDDSLGGVVTNIQMNAWREMRNP